MRTPRQIAIEVTNKCNLKCAECPQHAWTKDKVYPVGNMNFDLFKWIIDGINFETRIALWLDGEPLVHPKYFDMVDYIDTYTDIPWTITTNGMLLDESVIERLLASRNLYQVIFSVDGFYDETMETIRPGANLSYIKGAAERLKGHGNFTVGAKLTEKGQDYQEIEDFILYWTDKVDYAIVGKNLGKINKESLRRYPCRYFDDMLMEIRWDGRLIPCSYNLEAALGNKIDLGYVQDSPNVLEAYNNEGYRRLRKLHYDGRFPDPCKYCGFAYTGDGFQGTLSPRNSGETQRPLFYHEDYYNRFYSYEVHRGGTSSRPWEPDPGILREED